MLIQTLLAMPLSFPNEHTTTPSFNRDNSPSTATTISSSSSTNTTSTNESTAGADVEEKERFLLLHQERVYNNKDLSSNLSLPSMDHVLKNIESYQNQQQLNDSQLLLEFNQRNSASNEDQQQIQDQSSQSPPLINQYQHQQPFPENQHQHQQQQQLHHPQYTFQQRSESTNSLDGFQNKVKLEHPPPPHLHSHSQPQIPTTRTTRYQNSQPSTNNSSNTVVHRKSTSSVILKRSSSSSASVSTTPLSISTTSLNATITDDYDSRDSSVDSGLESPNLTPNGSNKKRTNLPRETIEILNEWILNNMDNPYPNHTQKRILLEQTGLSNVQLSNWFINKRRRRLFSNLSGNNGQPIKKKRLIDRL